MSKINKPFSFSKDWTDSIDFPTTEYSEKRVREDIQLLFDEIKSFINDKILGAVNDNAAKLAAIGAGGEVTHELMGADSVGADNIIDGSITGPKYGDNSIPNEAYQDGSITSDKFDEDEVKEYVQDVCSDKIHLMLESDEQTVSQVEDIVKEVSSNITFLMSEKFPLHNKGYSSSESSINFGIPFSMLGIPDGTISADILVRTWAEPDELDYSEVVFSTQANHFQSAYAIDTVSKYVNLFMQNNSPSTGERSIYGCYAIYLLER